MSDIEIVSEEKAGAADSFFRTDHLKTGLGSRTARGGAVTGIAQILKFVLSTGGTILLARLLSPQDYGLIGMVAFLIGFLSMLKDLGLSNAIVQSREISPAQISTLFWINVAVCVAMTLLISALAPVVAWFYGEPQLVAITIVSSTVLIFGGLAIQHTALLQRQMHFTQLAAVEIAALLCGLATAICLAWFGAHYWALVASQIMTSVATVVGVWLLCSWRPGLPGRGANVRSMLAFGGNFTGFSILNYFGNNLDNLLIGKFWGPEALGLYARAFQLLYLPIDQINTPLAAVSVPALSRLVDSPERYRQAYVRILDTLTLLTLPGVAFMIVTSDWLVRLLLGERWMAVAQLFSILGYAALLLPVANSTGWLFLTQGRTKELMRWGFIDSLIRIPSIILGVPWGPVGVSIGIVVRFCIQTPILFWFIGRTGPVKSQDFYRALASPLYVAVCVLLVLFAYHNYAAGNNLVINLCTALALAMATTLLGFMSTRRGRSALLDFRLTLSLLMARGTI